jgi:hypothetical protein
MIRICVHGALFLGLTVLTQIGGLAYLLTLLTAHLVQKDRTRRRWVYPAAFLGFYAALSFLATAVAPLFGRTPLSCFPSDIEKLAMQSPVYCALNRHYVAPELEAVLFDLASHVDSAYPGTVTLALDANFPFIDGFPLLPHLSHDDGRNVDLAFYYRTTEGDYQPGRTRSPIGYWAFETPPPGSHLPCSDRDDRLTLRWDLAWFRPFLNDYALDRERTRAAIDWLTTSGRDLGVYKIFIEPHLVQTLGLEGAAVRFQGCRAARHDDHVHVWMK